jgi:hypothetical protein
MAVTPAHIKFDTQNFLVDDILIHCSVNAKAAYPLVACVLHRLPNPKMLYNADRVPWEEMLKIYERFPEIEPLIFQYANQIYRQSKFLDFDILLLAINELATERLLNITEYSLELSSDKHFIFPLKKI